MTPLSLARLVVIFLVGVMSLIGCSGGGGGGGGGGGNSSAAPQVVASTRSFPVDVAMANLVRAGFDANLSVSGTIGSYNTSGTATMNWVPAIGATFEGQAVLDAPVITSVTLTANGQTASNSLTTHQFFASSNYAPLGQVTMDDGQYYVVTSFAGWPAAARVGDSGNLASVTIYSNYNKLSIVGYQQLSYAIEADTADTAILVLKTAESDANHAIQYNEEDRYRITGDGAITLLSIHNVDAPGIVGGGNLTITPTSLQKPGKTAAPLPWVAPGTMAPEVKYGVGGSVTGLTASGLVLVNGSESLRVAKDATSFVFPTQLSSGADYSVRVQSQPAGLYCSVNNGYGTVYSFAPGNIGVACVPADELVGGSISGLTASGLVLTLGNDTLSVPANARSFAFPNRVPYGTSYRVGINSQPSGMLCSVGKATGVIGGSPVADVAVTCDLRTSHCPAGQNAIFVNGDSDEGLHPGRETISGGIWEVRYWATPMPRQYANIVMHSADWQTHWQIAFSTDGMSQPLAVGTYANATRGSGSDHGGLEISRGGSGCNSVTGSFEIHDIAWDGSTLKRLTASFEHHCEGVPAALRGCVHFEQ